MPSKIVPSVLPADFARLGDDCAALGHAGCDRIQWDVMDGRWPIWASAWMGRKHRR